MTRLLVIGLLLVAGCSQSQSPIFPLAPSAVPTPPAPTPQLPIISGVVYESTADGVTPLAGVGLDITLSYQSWPPNVTTGVDGRYRLAVQPSLSLKVRAEKAGYSQPCGALFSSAEDTVLDVYVVADAILSTTGVPQSMPIRQPTITGMVTERMADGATQSLSGVKVVADFTGGLGWSPSATTVSDATGKYLLCGVMNPLGIELYATKPGYRPASANGGLNGKVDLELTRQ
jgi:hypothetical protein